MKTFTRDDAETGNAIANQLEQIAEEIRARVLNGRLAGTVEPQVNDLGDALKRLTVLVQGSGAK